MLSICETTWVSGMRVAVGYEAHQCLVPVEFMRNFLVLCCRCAGTGRGTARIVRFRPSFQPSFSLSPTQLMGPGTARIVLMVPA